MCGCERYTSIYGKIETDLKIYDRNCEKRKVHQRSYLSVSVSSKTNRGKKELVTGKITARYVQNSSVGIKR